MIRTVPLPAGADIVISQGDYGFQQVLDAFPKARRVFILTYSVSTKWGDHLLGRLKQLVADTEVLIVSNIPNNYARKRSAIEAYIRQLRPDRFRARVQTFYNFNNHAKIIAAEDIMYLGSGNFSSGESLECGVLVRGRQAIEQAVQSIRPLALQRARPHPTTHEEVVSLWAEGIGAGLRNHLATFKTIFGEITDKMSAPVTNLLADPCGVLDAYDEFADTFGWIVAEAEQEAASLRGLGVPVERLREIHRLLSLDTVRAYLSHERQKFVESYVADHPSPHVEAVLNDAGYDEDERRRELRHAADDCVEALERAIDALLAGVESACGTVDNLGPPPSGEDAIGPG